MILIKLRNIITYILALIIVLIRVYLRGILILISIFLLPFIYVPLKALKFIIASQEYWLNKLKSIHTFIYVVYILIYRGVLHEGNGNL